MISALLDFSHERDLNIDELVRRVASYLPDADLEKLRRAYEFAEKAHEGQKRSSGESYIIHPLNVSATLVKLHLDLESIISGLLHDVVEDCEIAPEQIEKEFGKEVAQIVVGLTKISKIEFKTKEENQAENFRKMVVAMAQDLRVIIVKLADRMHNMRTLQYVSPEKQRKIAQETLDIYVPLASRLGINSVKGELEDLCLRFLHPDVYYRLAEKVAMKKSEREKYIDETVDIINEKLEEYSVKADVTGRPKHFYSIYKKMVGRGVEFEQLHDILAFRIITANITECYKALGIIHSTFTPIPGRFKDYIAIPKVNNYQSLHTSVIGPKAERIEIQIRTQEMHEVAENGIAAHWKYKEGLGMQKLDWVEDLLEFNRNFKNPSEFLDVVKNDLDIGGVFIFTPTGDVKELRYGANPLDFAYAVHTEVGHRCVGAKVNGKMVPLKYRLKSGDTVEVITSKNQTPSKDWLKIVKTSRARTKIKQYLLKLEREKNQEVGEELLEKALKIYGHSNSKFKKMDEFSGILKKFNCANFDELLYNLGSGKFYVTDLVKAIPGVKEQIPEEDKRIQELAQFTQGLQNQPKKSGKKDNIILVEGADDLMIRLGRCCNPIPGDSILGFITRGRGITVHKTDCNRVSEGEMDRQVAVEWNTQMQGKHPVNIKVITLDRPGILSIISKKFSNMSINIKSAVAKSLPDQKGSFLFEVEVKDYSELMNTLSALESMEEVISVTRV